MSVQQQRLQFVVGGRVRVDECRHAVGAAPVHTVQHLAVQVDVEVGDGAYVRVAGNGDSIFRRQLRAIGRPDLEADPGLAHNVGRLARVSEIDAAIGDRTAQRPIDVVIATLDAAGVPVGRIDTVADIAADPQCLVRDMIVHNAAALGHAGWPVRAANDEPVA